MQRNEQTSNKAQLSKFSAPIYILKINFAVILTSFHCHKLVLEFDNQLKCNFSYITSRQTFCQNIVPPHIVTKCFYISIN